MNEFQDIEVWNLFLKWLPVLGGLLAGTIVLPGVVAGIYRSLKYVYGYTNDGLDWRTEEQKLWRGRSVFRYTSIGGVLDALITGGLYSFSGGLFWFVLILLGKVNEMTLPYGIFLGGILGLFFTGIQKISENNRQPTYFYWFVGASMGIFSGGGFITIIPDFCVLFGVLAGGILCFLIGTAGEYVDEKRSNVILRIVRGAAGAFAGGSIGIFFILLSFGIEIEIGGFKSFILFGIGGGMGGCFIVLIMSIGDSAPFPLFMRLIARIVSWGVTPFLLLGRFNTILCSHCFKYTHPLRSLYQDGIRYCEHCQQEVELSKYPGKLIFLFGISLEHPDGKRVFPISNPDVEKREKSFEVSEVHIDTKTCDILLLERFLTYIVNYPPTHGLKSVQVFYRGNLHDLGDNLKNALQNTFRHVEQIH